MRSGTCSPNADGKPLWKLLVDMSPEELVSLIPFRYITDALTPAEALAILEERRPTRAAREAEMLADGYPGVHDVDRLARLPRRQGPSAVPGGVAAGWRHFKLKVGSDLAADLRRVRARPRGDRR